MRTQEKLGFEKSDRAIDFITFQQGETEVSDDKCIRHLPCIRTSYLRTLACGYDVTSLHVGGS